ncbi:MAG: nucleotidyl transferase AbiEii/AbiGii toxin family protein [Candidatus Azobacteroides sp.]|nr:nucleotidyl transferase AbiEii/AbiGii toxin family protein [Candidatus Azobacteroides sp.]
MREALAEKTLQVIDSISRMECIKPYILVGGTALSLQLKHRLSEDLDFMRWQETKQDKQEVAVTEIKKELAQFHSIDAIDIFEFNHIEIYIDGGVKLSFYAPEKRKPEVNPVFFLNNLVLADVDCIAALKMEVLLRRTEFRDYYDLYCILKDKDSESIKQIIKNALQYSEHHLKSKNLIGILTNSERFRNSSALTQSAPEYSISAQEIEQFMIDKLKGLF